MKLADFINLYTDCQRRDLTINAIAHQLGFGDEEEFFDPFGGKQDLENRMLRHVSDAFQEDPVRVLRVARLRARFGPEWKVATDTRDMIHNMAKRGVLDALDGNRVWKELSRALMETYPRLFFDTLLECDALHAVFPQIYRLKSALESFRWHPEGDAYEHTMLCLTQAAKFNFDLNVRYAVLMHDLGKGITPLSELPKHYGHDVKGVKAVDEFSKMVCAPSKLNDHVKKATRYHMYLHKLDSLNSKTFVKMFDDMKVLNDPCSVDVLHKVGICDERGRLGSECNSYDHLAVLLNTYDAYKNVKFADVFPDGETNPNKIKDGLRRARIAAVNEAR